MTKSQIRIIRVIAIGSFSSFAIRPMMMISQMGTASWVRFAIGCLLLGGLVELAMMALRYSLRKLTPFMDESAQAQASFLDTFNLRFVDAAILFSAALSLFLELAIIRWQSSILPFIALYKNFSLLACFMGLGLGYALASRDRISLLIPLPLLAWQIGLMSWIRYGLKFNLEIIPFREQLTMGIKSSNLPQSLFLYALLALVFLMTALTFMPIGQLCGRLMERRSKLRAYGLNLLGSLLGVLLMLGASYLWTPPLVWFALCFVGVLLFTVRTSTLLMVGFSSAAVCTILLAWPVDPLTTRVYSPYQLLEIQHSPENGLPIISAAGHYFQRIFDLSDPHNTRLHQIRAYYDFPYQAHSKLENIAVVGAGTGNDVAATLRSGAGHVEAIEIDPAVLEAGKLDHPERPYSDPRVHAVVNDARSFLRTTDQSFDMIVYGLLDSHTLLSQGSSVRIDSFVYTLEGLREARMRLKSDGVLSLSFSVLSDPLGRKIYLMLQQAFDGRPPICIEAGYDGSIIFMESNDPQWTIPPDLIKDSGFSAVTARYADPSLHADTSTDDWPFFYMPRRIYPLSYLIMVGVILALSVLIAANFNSERPSFSHISFFFLGAGFMLIETKGITEMGLTFGNTWQVIGFVIMGILIMAFMGNCAVQWLDIKKTLIPYLFLVSSLAAGWYAARLGGFGSTPIGRLETLVVLTLPLLFSGIVFSTLLSSKGKISSMIAMNLMGAICGGLLEYNSMYFGFRFLYLIAMGVTFLPFSVNSSLGRMALRSPR